MVHAKIIQLLLIFFFFWIPPHKMLLKRGKIQIIALSFATCTKKSPCVPFIGTHRVVRQINANSHFNRGSYNLCMLQLKKKSCDYLFFIVYIL